MVVFCTLIKFMKLVKKILMRFFQGFLLLVLLIILLLLLDTDYENVVLTDKDKEAFLPKKEYFSKVDSAEYKILLKKYGKNKTLPQGFEWAALNALSHYPELKEVPVEFILQEAWIPLSSRPSPLTLIFPWQRRKYLVVISTKSIDTLEPILLKNLPFNEQVGVLGHELAHTVYYLDKSAWRMAGIAMQYLQPSFRKKFERETDQRAIQHGLGYQLYDYAIFVRRAINRATDLPQSVDDAEDSYLSPKEIRREMDKLRLYKKPEKETVIFENTYSQKRK